MNILEMPMTFRSTAVLSALVLASHGSVIQAQTKDQVKPKQPATAKAPTGKAKESLEAQFARQNFKQVLDTVFNTWFGKTYEGVNAVDLQGSLAIHLTPTAINAKVDQLGQGAVKGEMTKGADVNIKVKSTYFANADFRTELTGEFGNLLYYRVGNRGFLYSKEQNAWTSNVDPAPLDAPASFLGWFRQCINEIQAVYVDGNSFKASLVTDAGGGMQTLVFATAPSPYDPKKREQSMAESLGFWKKGRLEVAFNKATMLPSQMNFSNEGQGIYTRMTFSYNPGGKLNNITIANQSKGMEGPASLNVGYDPATGTINHLAGQMGFSQGTLQFDLDLAFAKGRKTSTIISVPPPTATKKGKQELETLLLVNAAGKMLDLQTKGLNLRSLSLANK
jgi:hypothetical protein